MKRFLLFLFSLVSTVAAPTQIRDTGYTGFGGVLFSGTIIITGPSMTTADGRTIERWQQSFQVSNGVISIDLEPNDTATPAGTSYSVVYRPQRGTSWSEFWVVPTSASPLKVNQVRVASAPSPAFVVQPQQIASGGAAPGQALLWNGASYAPGNVATGSAWGGITGNLAAQTDLSNALAGKASLAQVQVASVGSGAPSANCSLGQAVYTDSATGNPYWCTGTNVWSLLPLNWNSLPGKPSAFPPSAHASTHASGGSDPITPASIGAMAAFTTWPWTSLTGVPSTFAPSAHASTHYPGGSDSLSLSNLSQVVTTNESAKTFSVQAQPGGSTCGLLTFDVTTAYGGPRQVWRFKPPGPSGNCYIPEAVEFTDSSGTPQSAISYSGNAGATNGWLLQGFNIQGVVAQRVYKNFFTTYTQTLCDNSTAGSICPTALIGNGPNHQLMWRVKTIKPCNCAGPLTATVTVNWYEDAYTATSFSTIVQVAKSFTTPPIDLTVALNEVSGMLFFTNSNVTPTVTFTGTINGINPTGQNAGFPGVEFTVIN